MPSDPMATPAVARAVEGLAPAQHAFNAACEAALAQGEAWWSALAASEEERAAATGAELGGFANGHVDPARFSALFASSRALDPATKHVVRKALDALRAACANTAVATVTVERGGSLTATVDRALMSAGRAFAAARVIERVRAGGSTEPPPSLGDLPFRSWTRIERRVAPPIVVALAGADLHAAGLADHADGRQKIVLVADGPCPPAALARLVTPGTFVMQTSDPAMLERVARFDGPAVAAVVPESAAAFVHDPAAGAEPWQRMSIQRLPSPPFVPVPGMSGWQLREDVAQLEALAAAPASRPIPPGAVPSTDAPDAADRLAAWLLSQANLEGLA